jgi:hypothetical protein
MHGRIAIVSSLKLFHGPVDLLADQPLDTLAHRLVAFQLKCHLTSPQWGEKRHILREWEAGPSFLAAYSSSSSARR